MAGDQADTGPAKWRQQSQFELTDRIADAHPDLVAAFDRDPLARHDIELQLLVSGIRGSIRVPRLVLLKVGSNQWQLAEAPMARGEPCTLMTEQVFNDIETAERAAMAIRLDVLRGCKARTDQARND
jgi:hypothetical protein